MNIGAIICEYNPFHEGHRLHIDRTRQALGEDCAIVCLMSGSFVQRGEPAIYSKHGRAAMALESGADLVLELPAPWSMASAERFAAGAVSILKSLGLPMTLSFGSECGDVDRLRAVAEALDSPAAAAAVSAQLAAGVSYAAARESALRLIMGAEADLLRGPNNILAVEYLKSIRRLDAGAISAMTIPRQGAGHDGPEEGNTASASRLRELIKAGQPVAAFVPASAVRIMEEERARGLGPIFPEGLESAALYRLRTMTEEEYAALPDATEGLWRRLMEAGRSQSSLDAVLAAVKTKRYAMSRLRRMVMAALIGLTAAEQLSPPPYIRVLGANARGVAVLRRAGDVTEKPIITKPAAVRKLEPQARAVFLREAMATDIRSLAAQPPLPAGLDWTTSPVISL